MKYRYINPIPPCEDHPDYAFKLTIGAEYDVHSCEDGDVYILNDEGSVHSFPLISSGSDPLDGWFTGDYFEEVI